MTKVSTFLMFQGEAKSAITLYRSVLDGFEVTSVEEYGEGEECEAGQIKSAHIDFQGQSIKFFDSPAVHDFGFTPAISFFVEFDPGEKIDQVFQALSEGGQVMMPLDNYGFSDRFGWLADRFGVSWQLNLPSTG